MRRGQKPAKSREAKPPVARKSPKRDGAKLRDLERRLAEALKDKAEALDQQTATSEILRVIASSSTDTQPVFDVIARNAVALCDGFFSVVGVSDGRLVHLRASHNLPEEWANQARAVYPLPLSSKVGTATVIREQRLLHILDAQKDAVDDGTRQRARTGGYRTWLGVPLLGSGGAIGVLAVARREKTAFTDSEIALLQTFADQAVIAIENVRLFKELQEKNHALTQAHAQVTESLEQQTATSEILRVIASSPTDIQPVLDAVAESAARLCEAFDASVHRVDGERLRLVAHRGPNPSGAIGEFTIPLVRGTVIGRAVLDRQTVHVADIQAETEEFPEGSEISRRIGILRTILAVPLMREGWAVGTISVRRRQVQLFTERQGALLQTFADQAVIAIENVRLFNETKETLDQQTATADILRVISRSPTDTQPVFDAIAESAARLCSANDAQVLRVEGEILRLVAAYGATSMPSVRQLTRGHLVGRSVIDRRTIHVRDLAQALAEYPETTAARYGIQSALAVPLLRDGAALGVIRISRTEIQPFTDKQIALLQTFADQAVIAIENVRLFTELQASNRELTTALDEQTATSDILRVISQSQTDVQPVFDAIVQSAMRLLRADSGMLTRIAGDQLELAAFTSIGETYDIAMRTFWPRPLHAKGAHHLAIRDRRPVNIADAASDPRVPEDGRAVVRLRDIRSVVSVPLLRHDEAIGTIAVNRQKPGGFTDDEIALLQTFADQAVIAIENVRLFNETKEALERQTATSDILQVISSSPTDVQPVFDTIAERALRLCDARLCTVFRFDGKLIHLVAFDQVSMGGAAAYRDAYPAPPGRGGGTHRAILTGSIVHIPDIRADPEYELHDLARANDFGCVLSVPMLRDRHPIGAITVGREAARPFADEQIELLKTFADQALIAIENVKLFKELETRNKDLTEALDQQTATSDILRVISQSQTDVQPVFDAIVNSAVRLLRANTGVVLRIAGEQIELAASTRTDEAGDAALRASFPRPLQSEGASAQAIRDRAPLNIADAHTDPRFPEAEHARARVRGYRSRVVVPLLGHDEAVGAIGVTRREPGGFTDAEIALLQTFAAQAVIAIENARLLTELHSRTAELTQSVGELRALGEVGQAISSTLDLQTVLSTIVARATQLSGTDAGVIYEYDEQREIFLPRATEHLEADIVETMLDMPVRKGEGATGRLAEKQEPIQVPDILAAPAESRVRGALVRAGYRALLAVPLVREDHLIGGLTVIRKATGAFPPEIIELLTTFATQSALAIQNARLFREIEEKSRQLEVASQHKSEFLANMSHELRTPLNAIIGFSEVLTDRMFGELNEKQEEYLKDIYASGTHLLSLINDILDLSKIEAGRMELELTDFHLPTALDNALTLVRERAGRRNIGLQMSVDARLGEVRADERKIRQVVLNLLSNAIKFTPEGGRIEVAAVPKDGFVEVLVSDTGVGIAPEDQEAVFEEFRQVGTAEKKAEGTGLGLTLCRKFIELHGGRIWVKSQVGRGSTFTFAIPVRSSQ